MKLFDRANLYDIIDIFLCNNQLLLHL